MKLFREVSAAVPNIELRIVGPHEIRQGGSGKSYLEGLLKRAEGFSIVFDGPEFDIQRLAETYRNAHLFCYPSLAEDGEAFGIAPLEAMASGAVPIVSGLECFTDFIRDEVNGFVFDHRVPDPANALADKLRDIVGRPADIQRIAKQAVTDAQAYSVEKVASIFLSEFEAQLNNTGNGGS